MPPSTNAQIRGLSAELAQRTAGDIIGIALGLRDGRWTILAFATPAQAMHWIDQSIATPPWADLDAPPSDLRYAAIFDRRLGMTPVEEVFPSEAAFPCDDRAAAVYLAGESGLQIGASERHPKSILNQETNARFWSQTGYKPGRKLNMRDPSDRAMARVWRDIFAKVQAEDQAGRLTITYNHPEVERNLGDAQSASHAAEAHLDAAVSAENVREAIQHIAAASSAARKVISSARAAADKQPATASPAVGRAAAREAARAAARDPGRALETRPSDLGPPPDLAPPQEFDPSLIPGMPGIPMDPSTPMEPKIGPAIDPRHDPLNDPMAAPRGAPDLSPGFDPMFDPGPARQSPAQEIALAQAAASAEAADAARRDEHERATRGEPAPTGTIAPRTLAQIRGHASDLARNAQGDFVGVMLSPDDAWTVSAFPTADAVQGWYGDVSAKPHLFKYLAYYDKADPSSWPGSVNEVFGSSRAIDVSVTVNRPSPVPSPQGKPARGPILMVAGAGVALGALVIAATRRRRRSGLAGGAP